IAFDRSTLGSVIERLESKKLIDRKPSAEDKRVKLLYLTRAGAAILRDIMPFVEKAQARMLQPLKPADRRVLLALLTQLVDLNNAFRARFRNPYAVVHRGDLHGVFLRACQNSDLIELRVSSEVVDYAQDGSSVTVRIANGDRVTGSLLIGADGLWSNIRKQ